MHHLGQKTTYWLYKYKNIMMQHLCNPLSHHSTLITRIRFRDLSDFVLTEVCAILKCARCPDVQKNASCECSSAELISFASFQPARICREHRQNNSCHPATQHPKPKSCFIPISVNKLRCIAKEANKYG